MLEYKGMAEVKGEHLMPIALDSLADGEYYIELTVRKNKPREKKTLLSQIGQQAYQDFVLEFFKVYPKRRGSHFNKSLGVQELNKLRPDDMKEVLTGARNYAQTSAAKDGFAPDAHRWLQRKEWKSFQDAPARERNRATL